MTTSLVQNYTSSKNSNRKLCMNNEQKIKMRCVSTKNSKSMIRCYAKVHNGSDLCGTHKRCKQVMLPDGSVWKNENRSNKLNECIKASEPVLFWREIANGYNWDKLNPLYTPTNKNYLRKHSMDYFKTELRRMGFRNFDKRFIQKLYIPANRYFWFTNLVYYLGNFRKKVRIIEKFYYTFIKPNMLKKKKLVSKISDKFLNRKMKKQLPRLVRHGKIWNRYKCVNLHDVISQESFVDVNPERWAICYQNDNGSNLESPNSESKNPERCWWFDVSSAVQLLGSPSSHAGENPYNRAEFPPEFIMDVDEKLQRLKNSYYDLFILTNNKKEDFKSNTEITEYVPSPCYDYGRYLVRVKSTRLFESFKEHGFVFPAKIFMDFRLYELRGLAIKILEGWQMYPEDERRRLFPNSNIFSNDFIQRIPLCTNMTELRTEILDIGISFVVNPILKCDRASGCINLLMILGTINHQSHDIVKNYGMCECVHLHAQGNDNFISGVIPHYDNIPPEIIPILSSVGVLQSGISYENLPDLDDDIEIEFN